MATWGSLEGWAIVTPTPNASRTRSPPKRWCATASSTLVGFPARTTGHVVGNGRLDSGWFPVVAQTPHDSNGCPAHRRCFYVPRHTKLCRNGPSQRHATASYVQASRGAHVCTKAHASTATTPLWLDWSRFLTCNSRLEEPVAVEPVPGNDRPTKKNRMWAMFLISSCPPHVHPIGLACGGRNEIELPATVDNRTITERVVTYIRSAPSPASPPASAAASSSIRSSKKPSVLFLPTSYLARAGRLQVSGGRRR